MASEKEPNEAITFLKELAILKELEAGSSRQVVADIFKCSQSTISRVLLNKETILQKAEENLQQQNKDDTNVLCVDGGTTHVLPSSGNSDLDALGVDLACSLREMNHEQRVKAKQLISEAIYKALNN